MDKAIDAVLFDLDGTLANTAGDLAASACDALVSIGLPPPPPESLYAYGSRGGRGMIRAGWTGPLNELEFQAAFDVFLMRYQERMFDSTVLYPGISSLLQALDAHQVPWGIVTNKGQKYTNPLVRYLGLSPACLVCGDNLPVPKPSPLGLLQAADQLSVKSTKCIYVGDDGKDVAAASAANMLSIAALYGYSNQIPDPQLLTANFQAPTVKQLEAMVLELAA